MISFNRNITREHCGKCSKQVYLGQSAILCSKCDVIFHSVCLTDYVLFRENIYCPVCVDTYDIVRYNPYFRTTQSDNHQDRFYENEITDYTDIFDNISRVLEECRSYSFSEIGAIF